MTVDFDVAEYFEAKCEELKINVEEANDYMAKKYGDREVTKQGITKTLKKFKQIQEDAIEAPVADKKFIGKLFCGYDPVTGEEKFM